MIVSFFEMLFIVETTLIVLFTILAVSKKIRKKDSNNLSHHKNFFNTIEEHSGIVSFYGIVFIIMLALFKLNLLQQSSLLSPIIIFCNYVNFAYLIIEKILSKSETGSSAILMISLCLVLFDHTIESIIILMLYLIIYIYTICYNKRKKRYRDEFGRKNI